MIILAHADMKGYECVAHVRDATMAKETQLNYCSDLIKKQGPSKDSLHGPSQDLEQLNRYN